jgi:hypothetical protein
VGWVVRGVGVGENERERERDEEKKRIKDKSNKTSKNIETTQMPMFVFAMESYSSIV